MNYSFSFPNVRIPLLHKQKTIKVLFNQFVGELLALYRLAIRCNYRVVHILDAFKIPRAVTESESYGPWRVSGVGGDDRRSWPERSKERKYVPASKYKAGASSDGRGKAADFPLGGLNAKCF